MRDTSTRAVAGVPRAGAVGRPAFLRAPGALLRFLVPEAADEMALASQRVVPEKALGLGFRFEFPDLGPAIKDLLNP